LQHHLTTRAIHARWAGAAFAIGWAGANLLDPALAGATIHPPIISEGNGGDCLANWHSQLDHRPNAGRFGLMDRAGGSDDDYCYVEYGPWEGGAFQRRVTIPEDSLIGRWQYRTPDLGGFGDRVTFRVCEERDHDPDLCSQRTTAFIK
jgi:hypothetical protein